MQTNCGSLCYAAPELIISEWLYVSSAVDTWSCSIILYATYVGGVSPPSMMILLIQTETTSTCFINILSSCLYPPDYVSPEAHDLLSMMLILDPMQSASLQSIMAHPWLVVYAHDYSKGMEDPERAVMEQHQMKQLVYQRQVHQAAAAPFIWCLSLTRTTRGL